MEGIGASPGISIGRIHLFATPKVEIDTTKINEENVEVELNKFQKALDCAKKDLEQIKEQTEQRIGYEKAEIFEAHLMFLEDPEFITRVEEEIQSNRLRADAAVSKVINQFKDLLSEVEDEYMLARQTDMEDVGNRIINLISGKKYDRDDLTSKTVIVAEDLTPSDTAQLDTEKVIAFVTSEGSRTSHTTIMARSLGVPAVVAVGQELINKARNGQDIIVDGITGKVIIDPDNNVIHEYSLKKQSYLEEQQKLTKFHGIKAVTIDGREIEIAGNIGSLTDLESVLKSSGDGIGLFRTEFLFMDREKIPTEEEQFEVYKTVAKRMTDKSVIIRTLDIGGDKDIPYLELPSEMNPFLGYRAIRICLNRPDIFKPQLRALLRASKFGDIRIMYPMISNLSELEVANKILTICKKELSKEGKEYNENIKVGVMIETPAAVMEAREIARKVNFFSIGTNDLIQYTLAVDRTNDKIADLHSPYHPSVLRLIKLTVEAAHGEGITVGMCGEAAAEVLLIPYMIGLGIDELSMSAISILKTKDIIRKWSAKEAIEIVNTVIGLENSTKIIDFLEKIKK